MDENSLSVTQISTASPGVAEKELIEIDTYPEDGDVYSITVNGTTVSYTVTSADDVIDVRDSLINAINTDAAINAIVTANTTSGNLENAIELVADTPGSTGFTSSVFSMPSAHLDEGRAQMFFYSYTSTIMRRQLLKYKPKLS